MAIKKAAEINWKPLHFLNNVSASVGAVLKPAGFDNSQGIISTGYLKDPTDPQWKADAGFKNWSAFVDKHMAGQDKTNVNLVYGYNVAQGLAHLLKMCGDDLTRENVMEAGGELPERQLRDAAAGHHRHDRPERFRADPARAVAEVRRRSLGAVRRDFRRQQEGDELIADTV